MILLSHISKNLISMRVERNALIIQLITSLYCIVLPVAGAEVSIDGLTPIKDAGQSLSNPTFIKTDPNQQLDCKCDNGTCVMDGDKTVCICDPGFGKIGETTCKECECGAGFSCTFDVGFFSTAKKCLCTEGFVERNGVCKECNCGKTGDCEINAKGAKICRCHSGYFEINGHCEDIDECLDNKTCPLSNTLCINLPGSYKCVCKDGYQPINFQGDPRYTSCRENNASWHHVNVVLIVLLVASLVTLLGVMLIKRRRSFLMSRSINAYETL
ncbi:unnamed protein product [Larinioides sclopetarius]|uniref:EGF-like domain-containing protein n=1 Tax=Larinioides sclopetarius TaxID=280406 RepID=A0AAV2B155_9ARAC